jgi:hypothetical protein
MRDNHEGLPEILNVIERDGQYFSTLSVTILGMTRHIEFGIPLDGYRALKRITQTRPFDLMPGLNYRYFICDGFCRIPGRKVSNANFRIELGRDSKQIPAEIPEGLAKNFKWIFELSSFDQASHLKVTEPKKA